MRKNFGGEKTALHFKPLTDIFISFVEDRLDADPIYM